MRLIVAANCRRGHLTAVVVAEGVGVAGSWAIAASDSSPRTMAVRNLFS